MRRLIINTDGGSRGNPGIAGYGVVIADADSGEVIRTRSVYIEQATNNIAEYSAVVDALMNVAQLSREWGEPIQVMVRADSKLVVEQMTGNWKIKESSLQRLAIAAQRAYPAKLVTYKWVPRAQNKHADQLANEAMDRGYNPDDPADAEKVRAAAEAARAEAAQIQKLTDTSAKALTSMTEPQGAVQVALDGEIFAVLDHDDEIPSQSDSTGDNDVSPQAAEQVEEDQTSSDHQPESVGADDEPKASTTSTSAAQPGDSNDTYLVLVRHGATVYTEKGLLCGGFDELDPPLSATGERQIAGAARLAASLGDSIYPWMPVPTVLYASPVQRAAQLGERLADSLQIEVNTDERLREINVGSAAGRSMAEIWQEIPDLVQRWTGFEREIWPGLESMSSMCERLSDFSRDVWTRHPGETVVVACHEIVTRIITARALGWSATMIMQMEIPLGSTTILHRHADGTISLVTAGMEPGLGRL